jgi:D-sedoheptulose 7-phosphate isomerase
MIDNDNQKNYIKSCLNEAKRNLENFISKEENINNIKSAIKMIIEAINNGNKIFSCGNGGSMCDAMHFAEELTGRFLKDRNPLPAISISDPSHISCTANDYGYEYVFERMIRGLGKKGDVLLAISTSGNSANVIKAVERAKEMDIKCIGLLGKDGGKLANLCDVSIMAEGSYSARIQEIHIKCIHIIIEGVEKELFDFA